MINDPKTLILAFFGGVIPALIWLWFWLREDKKKEEPKGLLTMIFILGMLSVILVLPIQKFLQASINSNEWQLLSFATAEELIKYLIVAIVLYKSSFIDEPLDWPIYMITAALGFAALENMLFLIEPISLDNSIVGLLTTPILGLYLAPYSGKWSYWNIYGFELLHGQWKKEIIFIFRNNCCNCIAYCL